MTKRTPAPPPALPGYTFVQHVGSGGYADVFLYEQASPSRRVAVKVLDSAAVPGEAGRAMFTAEANLMARVSAHPHIVQVFQSDIAPDGRPYLAMEYYPGPNFYERARHEQLSIDEVLRVGVQVASAVETAHRAGVLHRDIKPANILTSEYRHPGLTDFGIAAAQGPADAAVDGVSIPWSSPESLGEQAADRRADVYSLAATIYTLLTGRAPFEISGGDNRPLAMMARIERNPLPSVGRADVPPSLERLLARSMAKDPAHRPQTAADLARELQAVESEMRFPVTKLELAGESAPMVRTRSDGLDDDSTRVKGITEVHAQGPSPSPGMIDQIPDRPVVTSTGPAARERVGMLAEPEVADTIARPVETAPAPVEAEPTRRLAPIIAAAAAVLVAVVAGATFLLGGGSDAGDAADDPQEISAGDINEVVEGPAAVGPSPVPEVAAVANGDGTFTFTWEPQAEGVLYAVAQDGVDGSERVSEASFSSASECVEVTVIAPSGQMSDPTRGCAG